MEHKIWSVVIIHTRTTAIRTLVIRKLAHRSDHPLKYFKIIISFPSSQNRTWISLTRITARILERWTPNIKTRFRKEMTLHSNQALDTRSFLLGNLASQTRKTRWSGLRNIHQTRFNWTFLTMSLIKINMTLGHPKTPI